MDREILEEARRTIELLREAASMLARERDEAVTQRAGDALTMEALHHEIGQMRASLAERDAQIASLRDAVHQLEERRKTEGTRLSEDELAVRLQYYYRDFLTVDESRLEKEDAERLYLVLKYLFGELRKAGLVVKMK